MKRTYEYRDIYSFDELISLIPYNAENLYSIEIGRYGFLHDVGIEITLSLCSNGEVPSGWETLKEDFTRTVKDIEEIWKINSEYGYH